MPTQELHLSTPTQVSKTGNANEKLPLMVPPQSVIYHRILKASTFDQEITCHAASPSCPTTSYRPRQGSVEVWGLATYIHIAIYPQHQSTFSY